MLVVHTMLHDQVEVRRETYSERRKGIGSHLEGALVDPFKEAPEDAPSTLGPVAIDGIEALGTGTRLVTVIVEDDGGRGLVLEQLAEDRASGCGALLVIVGAAELDENLGPVADDVGEGDRVALGGGSGGAEAEDV
jgi:hypothetical protein